MDGSYRRTGWEIEMQERKLPGLDVLRGIAILMVIVAHFLSPSATVALVLGNSGVILFFLLSGYLMDRNLAHDPAVVPYAIKRTFRILPPYWLSITLVALTSSNWTVPQIAANASFTAPVFGFERMSGVYWTLYIEVAFYMAAPFLRIMGERAIRLAPLIFIAAVAVFWSVRGVQIFAPLYILFCLMGMMIGSFHRSGMIPWFSTITQASFRPLEYCGHVSYSWYLTHFIIGVPILHLGAAMHAGRWAPCIVAAVLSFATSVVIFRYFEKPAMEIGRKVVQRFNASPGLSAISG
jgi:peptidoglycan/LPS O-acetylase OafA/YrhL